MHWLVVSILASFATIILKFHKQPSLRVAHETNIIEREFSSERLSLDTGNIVEIMRKNVKRSKKSERMFSLYIYRVLKSVHPELQISCKAMGIMNSLIIDHYEKLLSEVFTLSKMTKKRTVTIRDIQTAVRLLFPSNLARSMISKGSLAVKKYDESRR
uniref:Histone domain-containing protein n=1 Tax=Parastrongyloides trichosuri TaxID=131310 RepID=A0A0N4ZWS4_PARTI